MLPLNLFLLLGIGLLTGVMSGLMGIGGGIIMVPILTFFLGYTQQSANATSLVALLLPVGALGVWQYYRAGSIGPEQIKVGLLLAVGIFFGALFGAKLAVIMPEKILKRAFALFLVIVAAKLFRSTT